MSDIKGAPWPGMAVCCCCVPSGWHIFGFIVAVPPDFEMGDRVGVFMPGAGPAIIAFDFSWSRVETPGWCFPSDSATRWRFEPQAVAVLKKSYTPSVIIGPDGEPTPDGTPIQ